MFDEYSLISEQVKPNNGALDFENAHVSQNLLEGRGQ